ncbi:MAG: hypothetical protein LBS62_06170 [Clostridiales bacterium]|nr:hypothetical protein [Clostridiales bacterium]
MESYASNAGYTDMRDTEPRPAVRDEAIFDLAKHNLYVKRSLTGQLIDFIGLCIGIFTMFVCYGDDLFFLVGFTILAFVGIRLAARFFKFMRPAYKNGIGEYLRERRERSLELEYNRLRKLKADEVSVEWKR